MKKIIYSILMLSSLSSFAMVDSELDLLGERKTTVKLPFPYRHRKSDDQFDVIHQGGFKAYDRDSIPVNGDKIVVLGLLQPCIGIFLTDGERAVAFHAHFSNSLKHLDEITRAHLKMDDPEKIRGMIYSATGSTTGYPEKLMREVHSGRNHKEEIVYIRNTIADTLSIERKQIKAKLIKPYNPNGTPCRDLLRYDHAELFMGLSLREIFHPQEGTSSDSLPCYNIDPCAEDVLNLQRTNISLEEWTDTKDTAELKKQGYPDVIAFSSDANSSAEKTVLTKIQHRIYQGRFDGEQEEYYRNNFGLESLQLMEREKNPYRTLDFYPIGALNPSSRS